MNKLLSTSDLTKEMEYFDTSELFFKEFKPAWQNVRHQVLKLETRQVYADHGESWKAMMSGDIKRAFELLPSERTRDVNLYLSLIERNVEFIRCRPVTKPLTEYLKWEIGSYEINARFNEKIFFLLRESEKEIFDTVALHDFMIFDKDVAFIHNYDSEGEIKGGWKTGEFDKITNLLAIYSQIKASSNNFHYFLKLHNL